MKKLTIIIVDDERLARDELKRLLCDIPGVMIVGEASTVAEAAVLIERFNPNLILLDVQLGGETGFELLERTKIPADVIFVTAYDEQSLPVLQDKDSPVLVKPVNPLRLQKILAPYLNKIDQTDIQSG